MAYNVSEDWIERSYSGSSRYSCKLYINGLLVPIEQISRIDIDSPIIDNSSQDKPFYIGTFISQSIKIKFRNLNGLNIVSGARVDLYIGQQIDDETYEEIPIGKYLIDELAKNYQETCEINCLDYGVLFSTNCDYSSAMVDGKIEVDDLLEWICEKYGVELGDYPSTNGDVEIGSYDNTLSAKYYISCIAEIKGCNAKMDREGRLTLVPIKSSPTRTIDALKSKSWKLGEKYTIKTVTFFDAIRNYTFGAKSYGLTYQDNPLFYQGVRLGYKTAKGNTLIIRQDNPFVVDETVVENIYNAVKDVEIWNLKCENYGDLSLDAWDIVTYTLGEEEYTTYYSNNTTYEMTVMSKNEVSIPNKQQQVTTNVVGGTEEQRIKRVSTTVDNLSGQVSINARDIGIANGNISDLIIDTGRIKSSVTSVSGDIARVERSVTTLQSDTQLEISAINKKITEGVEAVQTTSVLINNDGISVRESNSKINTLINNKEFRVRDSSNNTLTFIGYDEEERTSKSEMDNLTVKKYFIAGSHRVEKIDDVSGNRTGWFYIG